MESAPGLAVRPVLYITYDGVLEPLGESQVLAYLERLAPSFAITLLSFEKPDDLADAARVSAMTTRLRAGNIAWMPLRYHRWPPVLSTAWDVVRGVAKGRAWRTAAPSIVHARGYVSSLIATAIRDRRQRFIFDMRGFWPDEKVDGGHWRRGSLIYRLTKRFERRFFQSADAIVSLTQAGVRSFPELGYRIPDATAVEVIPTCADLARYTPGPRDRQLVERLGLGDRLVIGSTGTLSNWYLRRETLAGLARVAQRLDGASVLLVTRDDHDALRRDAVAAGIPADRLVLARASFDEMPDYVRLFDLGLFFIKVCFSKRGSAATKLGEFLGCGVPVVINDGIGDSGEIVRTCHAGVVLASAEPDAVDAQWPAIQHLLADPDRGRRARAAAETYFDLARGSERYRALYTKLFDSAA